MHRSLSVTAAGVALALVCLMLIVATRCAVIGECDLEALPVQIMWSEPHETNEGRLSFGVKNNDKQEVHGGL